MRGPGWGWGVRYGVGDQAQFFKDPQLTPLSPHFVGLVEYSVVLSSKTPLPL